MAFNYSSRNDRDLVLACQRREPSAFEELVKRHQKSVYSLLSQLAPDWPDVVDLSQEVFIRVWRSINNLRNPVSFRSWLIKQVMSLFYEELPTRAAHEDKRSHQFSESSSHPAGNINNDDDTDGYTNGDENVLSDDPVKLVKEAMKRLPEPLRTPVVLRELEGLNYEEIAILTRTEVGTVKGRISKARARLQKMLRNCAKKPMQSLEVPGR
jgi:RNA polymerase sigma-70 factor (ECF subfamily)